jgi:quercetin dioxygenase-like cupin family protein
MSINRQARNGALLAAGGGETISSALGVTLTFKTVGEQSGGQFLSLEYTAPPKLSGPPPHWHKVTTEIFYVLAGSLMLSLDGETLEVGPGGYAYVPPRTVHTFSNQSDAPAKFFLVASPSGLENYFSEASDMLKDEPSWPPQNMNRWIALMAKYDTFMPPVE